MNYWQERNIKTQERLYKKNTKQIEEQLKVYYSRAMDKTITDFEATYDKLQRTIAKGNEPTPADLYKLDRYWKMQGQLQRELQKLGDKQSAVLGKLFTEHFLDVYNSLSLPSSSIYSTMDYETAYQMINQIWVADGKSWKEHIWGNITKLRQTLNDELINCVVGGKDTTELRVMLHDRFNVSYVQADTLVRTEIAHIQTQAAQKRYEDYGVKEVEIWADEDERRCKICGELHKTRKMIGEQMPIPAHPRCRCTIIPVID